MTTPRIVLATVLGIAVLFAVVTLLALEGREVVVLRTFDAQGRQQAQRPFELNQPLKEAQHGWSVFRPCVEALSQQVKPPPSRGITPCSA